MWVHTCNVTAYRNAVTLQVTDTIRSYDLNFHPVPHGVTVSCERYTVAFLVCYGSQKHHECTEVERSGRWWRVTLQVQTCSGRNRIIPLMRWPNTDSTPNMPVMLPRNQLLIRYVVTSPVHTVTIQYAVKLQVCTHLNRIECVAGKRFTVGLMSTEAPSAIVVSSRVQSTWTASSYQSGVVSVASYFNVTDFKSLINYFDFWHFSIGIVVWTANQIATYVPLMLCEQ
jgi:hypothetical protein